LPYLEASLILNRKQLADCFDVDESTVRRWADDGMPVERDRQGKTWEADSAACIAWLIEREKTVNDSSAEVSAQRARLLKAQANKAEHEFGETCGRLADVALVRTLWQDTALTIRARLLQLPRSAVPRLPILRERRAEAEAILRELVYEALNELAQAGDGVPAEVIARAQASSNAYA